jgi:hypothetical protein
VTARRRQVNWVLLALGTLIVGSFVQAFIPECGAIVASWFCDPALIYFATGAVAVLGVAVEAEHLKRDELRDELRVKLAGRPCPSCNTQVPTGRTRCEGCGYDFAAAARPDP